MTTLQDLQSMDSYDFEKLVGEIWGEKGYDTTVRQRSNDKAIDVEAVDGDYKILIQVKRYSSGTKVGGPDVRKYATLYQQEPDANRVVIVTSSDFTSQAKEIATEQNVKLVAGSHFIAMMNKYEIGNRNRPASRSQDKDLSGSSGKSQAKDSSDSTGVLAGLTASAIIASIIVGASFLILDAVIFWDTFQLWTASGENTIWGNTIGGITLVLTFIIYVLVEV